MNKRFADTLPGISRIATMNAGRMRRGLSALLAIILFATCCSTMVALAEEDYSVEGWYRVYSIVPENHNYSYIYSEPSSTEGDNLCRVDDGQLVHVFYKTNGYNSKILKWAYCEYEGVYGFIHFENLKLEGNGRYGGPEYILGDKPYDDEEYYDDDWEGAWDPGEPVEDLRVLSIYENAPMYERARYSSDIVCYVPSKAYVQECFLVDDDFVLCSYKGIMGFIPRRYLLEDEDEDIEPTKKPAPKPTNKPSSKATGGLLQKGQEGEDVRALQIKLVEKNFLYDPADGIFGANTKKAVERVQKMAGLPETGIVDRDTGQALDQLENRFKSQGKHEFMIYRVEYLQSEQKVRVYYKNIGDKKVNYFKFKLTERTESRKENGDFIGNGKGAWLWYGYDIATASGESGSIQFSLYEGNKGTFDDGESYTMRYNNKTKYACVCLLGYSTEDGKYYEVNGTNLYCSLR